MRSALLLLLLLAFFFYRDSLSLLLLLSCTQTAVLFVVLVRLYLLESWGQEIKVGRLFFLRLVGVFIQLLSLFLSLSTHTRTIFLEHVPTLQRVLLEHAFLPHDYIMTVSSS